MGVYYEEGYKWVFTMKNNLDESVKRYESLLVVSVSLMA